MKKRILSMLLVVAMIVSMASVAFAAPIDNYADVEKDTWYYEYVKDVVAEGYFIGFDDTTFSPETYMNRAQMVVVLARLAGVVVDGEKVNNTTTVFEDVASGTWYTAAVKWAYENGITTGITPTEFWPMEPVSREDACTFIIRYLNYMAGRDNVSFDHMKDSSRIFNFMDEASIRDYSAAAVDECMAYGMVWGDTGDETGYFYPQHSWRRCEGAKMISILADILESGRSNWIPTPPPPVIGFDTYSYSLVYHVTTDGNTWNVWDGKTQSTTKTVAEGSAAPTVDFTITSEVPASYEKGGFTYNFVGWTRINDNVADADCAAGGTVTVKGNGSVVLYAAYAVQIPEDDYIKLAVQAAIKDANEYIAKAEELVVNAGNHSVTVGNYVAAEDVALDAETNTVNVAVTGELYSGTVIDVIALATEYAVAVLGPNKGLPTKDEIKDIVEDVADSVGIELDGKTVEEIAEQVYDKAHAIGADIFGNFRNYKGGYCVNKITLKSGGKDVATLNVTNDKGLTTDGAEANKAAAKELALAVAEAMFADLKKQSGSNITLHASIVVEFAPNYVSIYNDTYTLNLAVTVKSDMYRYEGSTNTLYLVINKDLQEQYADSVEQVVDAAFKNDTIQTELISVIEDALNESGMLDSLGSMAAKDAVEAAMDLWVAANLKAEAADPIDTPFEFLWTKEGTILEVNGVYSTSTGTVLGDNEVLYTLVEAVYAAALGDVINKVDASMISGGLLDSVKSLLGAAKVDAAVAAALVEWKAANGSSATDANALYNFLYNGGKVVDNGDGTYTPASVGVNDALYAMIIDLCEEVAAVVADTALSLVETQAGIMWGYLDNATKFGLVRAGVEASLDQLGIDGDFGDYLLTLCMVEVADALGMADVKQDWEAIVDSSCVAPMIDGMLVKGLYNGINGSGYAEYVGLDKAGREAMVDQMILKTLATATVGDKTLGEVMAKAVKVKTIESLATVNLGTFAALLNNADFQDMAAQHGNDYVSYLASAITKLPAKASVTIDGVVITQASLEDVRAAAAEDDTKTVCTELAKIVDQLGHLTMNELVSNPVNVTVKYGEISADMNFGLIIE